MKRHKTLIIVPLLTLILITCVNVVHAEDIQSRIDKAGTYFYPFSYTAEDGTISETEQKATIIFPYSVINPDLREGIDASDIHIPRTDINNLSDQEMITLAHAHAWSLETGENIPIHEVKVSQQTIKPGANHKITFSTNKNTSISVHVYLSNTDVVPTTNKYINLKSYRVFDPRNLFWLLLLILLLPLIICTISFAFVSRKYRKAIQLLIDKEDI